MPRTGLSQVILDSLSEGVFTVGLDWKITSFNRSAEEITGIRREEAIGQLCSDVLHSTLCENHCPIRQVLAENKPVTDRRCYFVDIDGERVPISVLAAVLSDEEGNPLGGVETFRDLTELETLKKALQRNSSQPGSRNPAMQRVLDLVPVLAANPTSVLIYGETGTGKERIEAVESQSKQIKMTYKEKLEFEQIETMIAGVEAELKMLTLEVNSAGSDFVKLGELTAQQQDAEQRLEQLVERWTYLTELAEASGVF